MRQIKRLPTNEQLDQEKLGVRSAIVKKAAYRLAKMFIHLFGPYLQTSVLVDMARQAGVEYAVARCQDEKSETKPTLTELSLITGLDTRTVKKMMERPKDLSDYQISAEAAILVRWAREPAWRDPETDKPMDLPIFGTDGSFQGLVVRLAGRGVSTRAVLQRLEATGNVKVVNKHFVRLIDSNWRFIEDNEDEFLEYGSQALASLSTTIQYNLEHRKEPDKRRLERRVYTARISKEEIPQLRDKINQLVLKQKEEAHSLLEEFEAESKGGQTSHAVGIGYYYWEDSDNILEDKVI